MVVTNVWTVNAGSVQRISLSGCQTAKQLNNFCYTSTPMAPAKNSLSLHVATLKRHLHKIGII